MDERREQKREPVQLPARWESATAAGEGIVGNISDGGCLIKAGGRVAFGDPIRVEMQLPTERWISLWGVVAHNEPGLEFGVRFTVVDEHERQMLKLLMEYVED